jgi:queuine/archaeosine tRNA-ribosyltransferase
MMRYPVSQENKNEEKEIILAVAHNNWFHRSFIDRIQEEIEKNKSDSTISNVQKAKK